MNKTKKEVTLKTGIPRLLEITLTRKAPIITAIILATLSAAASFVPYLAIYRVIREIVSVYPGLGSLNEGLMLQTGWFALAGILINVLLYFASLLCSHMAAYGTISKLKQDFASYVAGLPLGFHISTGSGRLRKIMENNIEGLEGFIAHDLSNTVAALVSPVIMLVLVFAVDWRFGLMVLLGIVVSFVVQGAASPAAEKSKALTDEYQEALSDMSAASVEYIRGISVVKAFGQTAFSFNRLSEAIKNYTASVVPHSLSQETMMAAFTATINNMYLFLLPMGIIAGSRTTDYKSFVSAFIFCLIFVPAIGAILMKIVYVMVNANQSAVGVEAMDEILRTDNIQEPDNPKFPKGYDVRFENVDFTYGGSEEKALKNISFTARHGKSTAIVGASGGGKSTIANLIPRFYDVDSGSIKIGGVDIREMSMDTLMNTVSFVFQDSFLFKQSIFENIRIGRPDASKEEVLAAAGAAQCTDFIRSLPEGCDTVYGKNNVYLSGGEVQRVAIARAILKGSPVLVLDEATAFADSENEHSIQQALSSLMEGKTVIMIAHRLPTVKNADQILVMEEGRLCESGTHAELIRLEGRYAGLWSRYTEALGWEIVKEA